MAYILYHTAYLLNPLTADNWPGTDLRLLSYITITKLIRDQLQFVLRHAVPEQVIAVSCSLLYMDPMQAITPLSGFRPTLNEHRGKLVSR